MKILKCKYCGYVLTTKDWAMPAPGSGKYACFDCRDKAKKEFQTVKK